MHDDLTRLFLESQAGVNADGVIQYLNSNLYADAGSSFNDFVTPFSVIAYTNAYDSSKWSIKMYDVKTDKASTVWTRAPGRETTNRPVHTFPAAALAMLVNVSSCL